MQGVVRTMIYDASKLTEMIWMRSFIFINWIMTQNLNEENIILCFLQLFQIKKASRKNVNVSKFVSLILI